MASFAYSFLDIVAAIKGPNGSFSIGSGAGAAEEGITVAMIDAKNTMMIGADGQGMHSLHAGKGGTVTVRLLKTSPTNALLQDMYFADTASSATHGQNTIVIRDPARGDVISCKGCAFQKFPDMTYAKDGNVVEWMWDSAEVDQLLGTGTPAVVI